MNSRNSNESNLVNFSTDLTPLNQLETKDGLLTFPFDHIYACQSDSNQPRESLQLDKEVEISTHCAAADEADLAGASTEVAQLSDRLTAADNRNKRLKELLIYHLDLIQQQNDLITKKDKSHQALKQENEFLKAKLHRIEKRASLSHRSSNPPPLVHVSPSVTHTHTSHTRTTPKTETSTNSSQIMLNSFTELLIPDTRQNSIIFDGELQKPRKYSQDTFNPSRTSETEVSSFLPTELKVLSILDNKGNPCQEFTMIESKPSYMKKEMKTDSHARQDAIYTMTGNSANPVIQRIQRSRKRPSSSSLSRMAKSQPIKTEPTESPAYEEPKSYQRYSVNKKSKMINTYGKSPRVKKSVHYTGSLSDRLQLIDTTPTGEDPYQLGEAEMREQSPIPKLMLQKTNHGRVRVCPAQPDAATSSRHFYDTASMEAKTETLSKIKLNRYNLTNTYMHSSEIKKEETAIPQTTIVHEPDLDLVKTETEIDWQFYSKAGNATSLCDFSYGENSNNLASHILPQLDTVQLQDFFASDPALYPGDTSQDFCIVKEKHGDKTNRRVGRTTSLVVPNLASNELMPKPTDKRGRKRALSTTGAKTIKKEPVPKPPPKPKIPRIKAKRPVLPAQETQKPYHTLVGDPDTSWYLGLNPDVKFEDIENKGSAEATVEVPRWREKIYTSCYTLEGTEDLDDKVFEKRHQKLEAEERRQLRWHMRRVREQRHMERLRLRQRDPWSAPALQQPPTYTTWPNPLRDLQYIEITDTLPVTAFGEDLPDVPPSNFVLPWVRSSMKRAKRARTLH